MPASRLRSLSSVTGILDEIIIRPSRLARDPQAASLKIWYQVLLVSLVYEFAAVPFIITFQPEVPLDDNTAVILFYVVESLFLVDFYVKLTTGFYKDGNLVNDIKVTHVKYLKSREFAVDLLAILPFSTLPHYYTGTDTIDREVTKLLCPSIGKDVQIELLRDVVAKIPVFSSCRSEFIEVLTSLLERISLPAQCTLFSIGDPGDAMYIIHAGVLDVIGRKAKIRELRKNDFVGELSLFSSFPRSATVVTNTYCVLYKLSRFHTELVLDTYPTAANGIKKVVDAIIEKTQLKSKLAPVEARPRIKPRRTSSKQDLKTPAQGEDWPAPKKKLSLVIPTLFHPNSTVSPVEVMPSTTAARQPTHTTVRRPPRLLLQRVLSMKKKRLSDAMKDVYDEYSAPRIDAIAPKPWWANLLLKQCVDCSGAFRIAWIVLLEAVLIFNWCLIPVQLSFPAFDDVNWFVYMLNGVADAILWADMYGNFNLAFVQASETIRDATKSAPRYFRGAFVFDFLFTLPYEVFTRPTLHCLARVPRLLRVWRVPGHFHEVDAIYPLRSKYRLILFAVLLFLLIHIGTCLYFSFTSVVGFCDEEEGWLLNRDVELRRVNETHFLGYGDVVYALDDPELTHIATMQYLRSFYFATHKLTGLGKDAVTIALEISFVIDIYVRLCLGYREYGNKIMDLKLIRRRYLRSWYFVVDIAALLPLFMINWLPSIRRWELFNLNKVVRLLKVPNQFRALEQRYIKFTSDLRMMKLVYYTFLATHILGCIYFDFASHASGLHGSKLGTTSFGENSWSLPKTLERADLLHQYFASNFWAFGIMSASNTGEPPQTTPQCLLTIITLNIGFFLFAYVIGNFTDIIELANAEHREFNAKLGSIRRLLVHFKLPTGLQTKIKTLLFFKRFHSITQEEVLERWLPPPLMTDIRLLNLNPMIEKVPFLKGMDASITRMLVAQFEQVLILKDEHVYRFGDDGTDMYFVFTGILTKFAPKRKDTALPEGVVESKFVQKISDVSAGDFFGENALFADAPRASSVLSKTSCILYSLSRHSLEMVFDLFPDWKTRVLQTAKLQQKEIKQRGSSGVTLVRSFNSAVALKSIEAAQLTKQIVQGAFVSPGSWWRSLDWFGRFSGVLETQSPSHISWLRVVTVSTFYVAFMLPSCVAFEACRTWDGLSLGANILEVLCFIVFVVDVWVNLRLKETELAMELYEVAIRESYRRNRLAVDIVAALPVEYLFRVLSPPTEVAWLSANRCVKVLNVAHYMTEIHRQSVSYEWGRLQTISLLYMLVIYWGACAYLMFAGLEGYSTDWNSWFPSVELDVDDNTPLYVLNLRLLRGLFFAVTAFIKKGRTFMPEGNGFIFAGIVCFLGLMAMAFMIGETASLFISSIDNEIKYRKNHIAVEHTIVRWKVSAVLNARVHVFLSNLWSSHRGVVYHEVFSTLPPQIRQETVLHIVDLPLQAFVFKVFRPLAQGDGPCLTRLTQAIADHLRFDSYPSGECVLQEQRMPEGVFFVVSGHLLATTKTRGPDQPVAQYTRGDYFGERAILTHTMSSVSVQTQMPCDLFLLSTRSLLSILSGDEFFSIVQIAIESLLHAVQRKQGKQGGQSPFPMPPSVWEQWMRKVFQRQRLRWAMNSSEDGSPSCKGEVLWSKLLASVLDTSDAPLSCFQVFRPFLEMAGPSGELFDRIASPRCTANALSSPRRKPGEQFRSLARQIGIAAISTKNLVVPILNGSPVSRFSASSVSRNRDRSTRFFTERSQRPKEG
ncbi:hypothetical protein PF003_g11783 [Phytophthora fragariae]|nr:hypothetical protein PF003_g11783 [Phytophthora fragariae]